MANNTYTLQQMGAMHQQSNQLAGVGTYTTTYPTNPFGQLSGTGTWTTVGTHTLIDPNYGVGIQGSFYPPLYDSWNRSSIYSAVLTMFKTIAIKDGVNADYTFDEEDGFDHVVLRCTRMAESISLDVDTLLELVDMEFPVYDDVRKVIDMTCAVLPKPAPLPTTAVNSFAQLAAQGLQQALQQTGLQQAFGNATSGYQQVFTMPLMNAHQHSLSGGMPQAPTQATAPFIPAPQGVSLMQKLGKKVGLIK